MKKITAIVQPFQVSAIVAALEEIPGLPGVTMFDVQGFGRQPGRVPGGLDDEGTVYVKKIQLEVVVPDKLADVVVSTICDRARTGNPGDGKIFVHAVDDAVRIRTGERGEAAL